MSTFLSGCQLAGESCQLTCKKWRKLSTGQDKSVNRNPSERFQRGIRGGIPLRETKSKGRESHNRSVPIFSPNQKQKRRLARLRNSLNPNFPASRAYQHQSFLTLMVCSPVDNKIRTGSFQRKHFFNQIK